MPVPNLRHADNLRNGITHETVVYDDIIDSLFVDIHDPETGDIRQALSHEDSIVGLSKAIDRFSVNPDTVWLTDGMKAIDEFLASIKKQQTVAQMLKRRLSEVRYQLNRQFEFESSERAKHLPDWKAQKRRADR